MTFLYAAYGSNLNHKQMATRCPNAEFVGTGKIVGVQLVFRVVADVEPALGSEVSVGLWRVTEDCLRALDRYEGYPSLYDRTIVCVDTPDGGVAEAWVYFMNFSRYEIPSEGYYDSILQGYQDCGLEVNDLVYAVKKTFLLQSLQKNNSANTLGVA
jgi:gamma-glutamylcyclotransferase (GGCT)/AIG2-like uncharacterized protein YtfP